MTALLIVSHSLRNGQKRSILTLSVSSQSLPLIVRVKPVNSILPAGRLCGLTLRTNNCLLTAKS